MNCDDFSPSTPLFFSLFDQASSGYDEYGANHSAQENEAEPVQPVDLQQAEQDEHGNVQPGAAAAAADATGPSQPGNDQPSQSSKEIERVRVLVNCARRNPHVIPGLQYNEEMELSQCKSIPVLLCQVMNDKVSLFKNFRFCSTPEFAFGALIFVIRSYVPDLKFTISLDKKSMNCPGCNWSASLTLLKDGCLSFQEIDNFLQHGLNCIRKRLGTSLLFDCENFFLTVMRGSSAEEDGRGNESSKTRPTEERKRDKNQKK